MIEETATRIALCEREHGIDVSVEDTLRELKFGLVEVVYEWARGMVSTRTDTGKVKIISVHGRLALPGSCLFLVSFAPFRSFWRLQS
jgi:hypothetical protein